MNTPVLHTQSLATEKRLYARKILYQLAGHLFFGLGAIGMLLPALPTTVFWIAAAGCYLKSSPDNYRRLASKKHVGKVIVNYIEHGVIGATEKKVAIIGMTISSLLLLALPVGETARIFSLTGILLAALYVLTRPGNQQT
jgi:uncharacterized protein